MGDPVRDHVFVEALEPRALLAVTLDEQGWSNFTQAEGARTIYVSNSTGSDKNPGTSKSRPVQTLAKARSMLRDGYGDWMLLKSGDVWYENLAGWNKSGKSEDFPLLISTYDRGERPVLQTGAADGFSSNHKPITNVAIVGLLFHANTRNPDSREFKSTAGGYGLHTLAQVDHLLVENCLFDSYVYNISIQGTNGTVGHIGLRRNVVVDAYADNGGKSIGLYMSNAASVLIEGNVFDHNGWNEKIAGAIATPFNHNIYLDQSVSDVFIRGNIIARAASHGLQARGGGTIQGNLFIHNPIGMLFGNGSSAKSGGVNGDVSGNVFLGTGTINGAARGWALEIGNTKPAGGTIIARNIFAQDQLSDNSAIVLSTGLGNKDDAASMSGINDLTLEGNIVYRWNSGITINGDLIPAGVGANALNGLIVRNNDFQRLYSNRIITQGQEYNAAAERFQGNRYYNPGDTQQWFKKGGRVTSWDQWYAKVDKTSARIKVKYDDPERNIERYQASLSATPTVEAFIAQARLTARRVWDERYSGSKVVEYMHQGFKVRKIPPIVTATNLSSKNTQPTRSAIFFLFDKDVSASVDVDDLIVTNTKTGNPIASSSMQLEYDPLSNKATWTFPKLQDQMLAPGEYEVQLSATGIWDIKNTKLDGDYDNLPGGNFSRQLKIKPPDAGV